MAHYKKTVLFITAGLFTIIVTAVLLARLFNIRVFEPLIETTVSTALGMDVRVEAVEDISVFPSLSLTLRNVNLQDNGADVITIDEMKVALKLLPFTGHNFQPIAISLVNPSFFIVGSSKWTDRLDKLIDTLCQNLLVLNQISIIQGNLFYTDEASGVKINIMDFDLSLSKPSYIDTDIAKSLKGISFIANAEGKTLMICGVTLTDLAIKAEGEKGIIDITLVHAKVFGGTGNAVVHMDLTRPLPHYGLIYSLNQFEIGQLLQIYSREEIFQDFMEGRTDSFANLTAKGKNTDQIKRSLGGDVSLGGENLILNKTDIDALILKYEQSRNFNLVDVGAFFLAGPFGPVLTKMYNFADLYVESQGGKGIIRQLVSVWKVKNGIAEARDVALASKEQRIAMTGGLNFIDERFVDVIIAPLNKQGCAIYTEKVNGPFRNPHIVKEDFLTSVGGSVLKPFKDAWEFIQGHECVVFYSGSVAHPQE